MTPHHRPPTLTGTPTAARIPARGRFRRPGPRRRRSHRSARPARLEHQRGHVPAAEVQPGADRGGHRGVGAPRARQSPRRPGVPAIAVMCLQQPPGLRGDRGEHVVRRRRVADQHRHPPQRGLLLANPRSSMRACAFAIAVAASSVKLASRASVPRRQRLLPRGRHDMTPHSRPSTLIGTPTDARRPSWRATSVAGPEAPA